MKKFLKSDLIIYSFVSFVCTGILYFLYILINWMTNGRYIIANLIAYTVSFAILFVWDQKLFDSKPSKAKDEICQLFIFVLFRVIGFIIDSSILILLIEKLKLNNLISKIISSMATFSFNYITNKKYVFNQNKSRA